MLQSVDVGELSLASYRGIAPEAILDNDLGLLADWKIITGDEPFFRVTKTIHNGLQGARRTVTDAERATYRATSERSARWV